MSLIEKERNRLLVLAVIGLTIMGMNTTVHAVVTRPEINDGYSAPVTPNWYCGVEAVGGGVLLLVAVSTAWSPVGWALAFLAGAIYIGSYFAGNYNNCG